MLPMTWAEKSALLRDRYFLFIGPCLMIVSGAWTYPITAWFAGVLLAGLTINRLAWIHVERRNALESGGDHRPASADSRKSQPSRK